MVASFYLIRHGETEWNRNNNRYCGRTDIPLTDTGTLQANNLAGVLQTLQLDLAVVSPMLRARQTAEPIVERLGLEMRIDDRLREIDFGEWEGLTQEEIERYFPRQWDKWLQDPMTAKAGGCGESATEVFDRMKGAILGEDNADTSRRILIVSHNTALRLFFVGTLGVSLAQYRKIEIDNAGVLVLETASATDIKWKMGHQLMNSPAT